MDVQQARDILNEPWEIEKSKNKIFHAVLIFYKYYENLDDHLYTSSGYIYITEFHQHVSQMTEEDVRKLAILGWFVDDDEWVLELVQI